MNSLLKFEMHLPMMRECIAPFPQGQAETVSATPAAKYCRQSAPATVSCF
jgi:hypothetical protein